MDARSEQVNGVVIGEVSSEQYYTFRCDGKMFASGNFTDDKSAEVYLKDKWPVKYEDGIEMRCFDAL